MTPGEERARTTNPSVWKRLAKKLITGFCKFCRPHRGCNRGRVPARGVRKKVRRWRPARKDGCDRLHAALD